MTTKKKVSKKKASKKTSDDQQFIELGEAQTMLDTVLSTMHGDMATAILDEVRSAEDSWQKLPESKQRSVIDRINRKSENMIRQMFSLIARRGFDHATATVKQVAFKDCAKIAMESQKNEGSHNLADRINQSVIILFVDPEEYLNGGEMPKAEKDQRSLDV